MWRYFAIATVIVLAIVVTVTARTRLGLPGHLNFWKATAPPPPAENVFGNAPWALSALPDCFVQRSETTGSAAYVRAQLPAGAQPVAPGTRLTFGPCTIFVRRGELLVDRGSDRLRVPPETRLYRFDDSLALLRDTPRSNELRIYDITANHE
ncbi:MAG TPA: hypothetical protein VMA98_09935 [Candidatus Acidoferrales bacterium]|nr:hypothetical protein [Candidatus Acidoferrales bacterium]